MDESYRVEVLHIVNPHVIFVESQAQKNEPVIQQVGLYGVLPVHKTIDIDGEIVVERCDNWPIAANTILREFLAQNNNRAYFVPIHDDERSTIFDQNIHQFGDFVIKSRKNVSITDYLIDSAVAIRDECSFLKKLSTGSLKLKLNITRTEEVFAAIKKYYQKQQKIDYDWQKIINKQSSVYNETKKITAKLTEENLRLFEKNSTPDMNIMKKIEMKEHDFNLCKDSDLVSLGRAARRQNKSSSDLQSKQHSEDKKVKPVLDIYGQKRNTQRDNFMHLTKENLAKLNQSTCKRDVIENVPPNESSTDDIIISDDEWDNFQETYIPKLPQTTPKFKKKLDNEVLQKSKENVEIAAQKPNRDPIPRKSKEKYDVQEIQNKNQHSKYDSEDEEVPQARLNSGIEGNISDQNSYEVSKSNSKQRSDLEDTDKGHKKKMTSKFGEEHDLQHSKFKGTSPLKPKERRLVFCPDMDMSPDNLKKFVAISISENCDANYVKTIEEPDEKSPLNNQVCSNITQGITAKAHVEPHPQVSHSILPDSVKMSIPKPESRLNMTHLQKKLLALKNSRKDEANNSISSNSDVGNDRTEGSPKSLNSNKPISDNSYSDAKPKISVNYSTCDTDKVKLASQSESKNAIKNSSAKVSKLSSSHILQVKLQALKASQKTKYNSFSSTSDTSVKDTSSSMEQLKVGPDLVKRDLEQAKGAPGSVKLELDPTLNALDPRNREPDPVKPILDHKTQPKLDQNEILKTFAENISKIERNVNPFKNLDGNKSVFVDKLVTSVLMVHTKNDNLVLPTCELRDVPFKANIRVMLKNMHIERPKRLQTVTWRYILRGHSMFIIGPSSHGKTVGYVPAICNLVAYATTEIESVGPVAVIVCATSLSVSEVEGYCKKFLSGEEKIVVFYPGIDTAKVITLLLNGCHVLICTAPALVTLLETDFGVDLRRLAILVFDDCERLNQVYATEVKKITQNVNAMLKKRADKAFKVQYIVASREWCDFMTSLAKKAQDTIIAIGASQECVLYSKTNTTVHCVKSMKKKMHLVLNLMDKIDCFRRTVIVCRTDDEVDFVGSVLMTAKYTVFHCDNTMTLYDLFKLNEDWAKYKEPISGPVLVCCDGNLTHLNITNANYLIHFSLPPLFSMFCKRFSVLNDNYASIFKQQKEDVKIMILLDETNVEQLPKIFKFVKRCTNEALPDLESFLQDILKDKDLKKAENLTPICNNLLMLGECVDIWSCHDRHTVFEKFDAPKDWMPKHGVVTFKITNFDSAVTYSARVLSKLTDTGLIKFPNNYNTLSLKMGMHYSKEVNQKLHGTPHVGDICAVALKQNFFERCMVLKVMPSGRKNTNHVLINLIDEEKITVVSDVRLYYLPDDLKAIETYVVKVRLANIQPLHKDVTFSVAAQQHLQHLTDLDCENRLYMRGKVIMTLGNCIFVETAEACVDLSSLGETVVKRDFRKELLDRHAEPNSDHIKKLLKISGIPDTIVYNADFSTSASMPALKKANKPKWAHLDKDDFSTVIFAAVTDASTIFLQHTKFQKLIDLLQKDIQVYTENAPEVEQNEIYIGNIVLAEFPDDKNYERARIDELIDDKKVKCFFVDNGDWRHVDIDKLKPITDNILRRIPFQAIESRLVGVKPPSDANEWPEFSTNWLDENCFEDKEGRKKQLFVKYFTKDPATVTGGHKYGVVLIDTSSNQDIVINKKMIELNLAKEIEDEQKYIDEPFDLTPLKVADSSSDNEDITDNIAIENENTDTAIEKQKPVVKDLVPLQPEENYDCTHNTSTSKDIPLNILFGKPIRSVPLINSDSDSDLSDKWDVNVGKDLLGMFGQPSKICNMTELNTKNKDDTSTGNPAADNVEPDNTETAEIDNSFEKTKASSNSSVTSSNLTKTDNDQMSRTESPSLDSDDIDIEDRRSKALDIFERKFFNTGNKEESFKALDIFKRKICNTVTKNLSSPTHIENNNAENSKNNTTLDSDDLSSITTEFLSPVKEKQNIEPSNSLRKPKLVWRQNKNTVVMKINLIGVESYTLELTERQVKFETWHDDTRYGFDFELYGVILPKKCVNSNKGQYILVRLVKMLSRNWLNLTKDFSTKKWVVYDVDAIDFSSDEEDSQDGEAQKVIKYNHEKVDSASEDEEDFVDDLNFAYKRH